MEQSEPALLLPPPSLSNQLQRCAVARSVNANLLCQRAPPFRFVEKHHPKCHFVARPVVFEPLPSQKSTPKVGHSSLNQTPHPLFNLYECCLSKNNISAVGCKLSAPGRMAAAPSRNCVSRFLGSWDGHIAAVSFICATGRGAFLLIFICLLLPCSWLTIDESPTLNVIFQTKTFHPLPFLNLRDQLRVCESVRGIACGCGWRLHAWIRAQS